MIALLLLGSAAFGALDQWVGSLTRLWAHAWEVPALSAPWLLLPFLAGALQRRPRRAVALGAAAPLLALTGYGAMVVSPLEGARPGLAEITAFGRSNALWFAGAALVGPLLGWLGHRWRVAGTRSGALLVAAAGLLEPVAHALPLPPVSAIPLGAVTGAELAVGALLAAVVLGPGRREPASGVLEPLPRRTRRPSRRS